MKVFKSKISQIIVVCFCAIIIILLSICIANVTKDKPVSVNNKYKLESIYKEDENIGYNLAYALCLPYNIFYNRRISYIVNDSPNYTIDSSDNYFTSGGVSSIESSNSKSLSSNSDGNNLDFSSTNIQVENVDEADVIKTDGNYIYSISENEVIITDVSNVQSPKIVSRIKSASAIPIDMMLYEKYLVVINKVSSVYYSTDVKIYDVSDKTNPVLSKSFRISQEYYTSRMIDGNLYIISNGRLKMQDNEVIAYYEEDNEKVDINLNKMYYFKDNKSSYETILSHINLDDLNNSSFDVQAYLSDVDYIYVSENNIYLADRKYKNSSINKDILNLFGVNGIWGYILDEEYDYGYVTEIMKLHIEDNGKVKYIAKNEVIGEAIDQFSFDEYDLNLRVAIQDSEKGSKIVVFDDKMKKIGESKYVGENEDMYSSRFVGEKAYLVTYRNMDPLFVFDLSNAKTPKVLGELEIPGYSTYLHPYDENHIIGIGIQTEERIIRDSNGEIMSTSAYVTGMKMALFDVSDVQNPKQISEVTIGDKRTKSAILTNHKALLFSKEKGIIAIPVNSYKNDVEDVKINSQYINDLINSYDIGNDYISEGYLVYNIDTQDGIKLKGIITHEENNDSTYKSSQVLRGLYIKDNLFTVSQHMLKVNKLDTLEEISNIGI